MPRVIFHVEHVLKKSDTFYPLTQRIPNTALIISVSESLFFGTRKFANFMRLHALTHYILIFYYAHGDIYKRDMK